MFKFTILDNDGTNNVQIETKTRKTRSKLVIKEDDVDSERSFKDSEPDENTERTEMTCRYCDMNFRSKVRLKKHELKHKNGFKCHICGKEKYCICLFEILAKCLTLQVKIILLPDSYTIT